MSELRSALERLRLEVLAEVPDARLEEDFCELQRASELLEAERLRRLAEIDRRGMLWGRGFASTAAWLCGRFRMGWGWARRDVHLSRALEQMSESARAFSEGELSESAVRVLIQARDRDPEAFGEGEAHLVEAARIHSTGDLKKVAAYWAQAVDRDRGVDTEERLRSRRRLHASVTFMAWSGWTGTWIRRPERPCSRPCVPCWTRRPGPPERPTTAPRPSGGPTP